MTVFDCRLTGLCQRYGKMDPRSQSYGRERFIAGYRIEQYEVIIPGGGKGGKPAAQRAW
jgi:hypothetical protein